MIIISICRYSYNLTILVIHTNLNTLYRFILVVRGGLQNLSFMYL